MLGEVVISTKSKIELEDGTTQWIRWECRPWYENDNSIGGIILHTENISERVEMEDELKKRESSLRGMFEQAAVGMSYGPHKLLTNVNQKYCDIVGYSKEELAELTYMDITYPEDVEKDAKSFEALINGELNTYTIEKRLIRKDKSIVWINLTVSIVPQTEGDFYVLAVIEDINERKNAELSMHFLNYHDQLTGCYNRRYYEEHVLKMDESTSYPLSLVMVDADGLKLVNDALGHLYGDKLLVSVANTLVEVVNTLGKVCRIGGDEFIITLPNTTYEKGIELIQRINEALLNVSVNDFKITVSCGCSTKTNVSQSIMDIFSQAEDIMYREKLMNSQNTIQKTLDQVLDVLFERSTFDKSHAKNVLNYCMKMAEALHYSNAEKELLMKAAYIHDIGKIGIDTRIINKKSRLTKIEMKEVKRHSEVGYRILNSSNHFSDISMIILAHHERWDGKGYPKGLKGKEIPEYARILAIAETYDVLVSHDSYKERISKSDAFNELLNESGAQFDPEMVIRFVETIGKAT
jgi:diguanylate cyclase (GGDEF)-like protein/PAS domain S-box-containing protein/putative nucleotidyltransferase with HDIG domain